MPYSSPSVLQSKNTRSVPRNGNVAAVRCDREVRDVGVEVSDQTPRSISASVLDVDHDCFVADRSGDCRPRHVGPVEDAVCVGLGRADFLIGATYTRERRLELVRRRIGVSAGVDQCGIDACGTRAIEGRVRRAGCKGFFPFWINGITHNRYSLSQKPKLRPLRKFSAAGIT